MRPAFSRQLKAILPSKAAEYPSWLGCNATSSYELCAFRTRKFSTVDHLLVLVMWPNPEPDVTVRHRGGDGTMIQAHANRPDIPADFFELEAGMVRVGAPEPVVFEGEPLNGTREGTVRRPKICGGAAGHGSLVVRPARKSSMAFCASRSNGPPGCASRCISSSHNRAVCPANQRSSFQTCWAGSWAISDSICSTVLMR